MEDDIIIDNYLKGFLSKDEEKSFLQRLASDVAFNEKFKLEEQLFHALNEDSWSYVTNKSEEINAYKELLKDDDLQNLKKTLETASTEFNSKSSTANKRLYYYLAAACIIIFLGFQMFFNQGVNNQELYADYIGLNELPSFVSRDNKNTELAKAQELFEAEKYKEALEVFQSQVITIDNKANILLYKGVIEIELNKYPQAEQTFNDLINSDLLDAEKGYWYKALLFLKENNVEDTKIILKKIIEEGLFNKKKAKKLLEGLQ